MPLVASSASILSLAPARTDSARVLTCCTALTCAADIVVATEMSSIIFPAMALKKAPAEF
jgi:hypothetical protein